MKKSLSVFILFTLTACFTYAQITIKGTITEASFGEGVIGASVIIKGTNEGAVSDFEGKYTLSTSHALPLSLVISYTGYTTQEVVVNNVIKPIDIVLSEGVQLDECVVVGKAIKRKSKSSSLSISTRRAKKRSKNEIQPVPPPAGIPDLDDHDDFNTEDYDPIEENRFLKVINAPLSTFSIDVDAASYSNLRRYLKKGQMPPKDAVRIEEMVNYFDYDYPQPQSDHPFEVVTEISDCPWNSDHRLLHIGLQGKKIAMDDLPASNLVFLLDVSGSMNSPNKLPLLINSLKMLVDQLRPQDRVAIVVYAGAAGTVLNSTSGRDKQKIKNALNRLEAGGSTAGAAGIKLAYKIAKEHFVKEGNNRVILATDGDFNVGTSSDGALVRIIEEKRETGIFLTVLGFGMGNYKDNKMQKLANKGNGNHAYIDSELEAKKVLVNEFGGTLFTIAKDVKLQLEFNPSKVKGYRLIGYENRMLKNEDFKDDTKDAGELGSGHTVTAIYEIIPAGVKSEFLVDVDPLKYQKTKVKKAASNSDELLTIKLRYKKPDGHKSREIIKPVIDHHIDLSDTSDNFRWSAAAAAFGLLLRDSKYKSDASYDMAIRLAKKAKGNDPNGYRNQMVKMLKKARNISEDDFELEAEK